MEKTPSGTLIVILKYILQVVIRSDQFPISNLALLQCDQIRSISHNNNSEVIQFMTCLIRCTIL